MVRRVFLFLLILTLVAGQILPAGISFQGTVLASEVDQSGQNRPYQEPTQKKFAAREEVVPQELGKLKSAHLINSYEQIFQSEGIDKAFGKIAADKQPFVIVVEDAHASLEAQMNIANLIQHARRQWGVRLIALEGAEGKAPLEEVRAMPGGETKEEILDFYLREALLTGPEYEALRSPEAYEVIGVEEKGLYEADRQVYLELSENRSEISRILGEVQKKLNRSKEVAYSKELLIFDGKERQFQKNSFRYFPTFVPYLVKLAQEKGIVIPEDSELAALARVMQDASEVSSANLEQELVSFKNEYPNFKKECDILEKRFLPRKNDFNFAVTGAPPEIPALFLYRYKTLRSYLNLAELRYRMNSEKVFAEIDELNLKIKKLLSRGPEELELDEETRELDLVGKILYLEARPEDLKTGFDLEAYSKEIGLSQLYKKARYFYELAEKRDETLALKTLTAIEESKVEPKAAVLVAGGFHAEGIQRVLEKMKVSYIVLSPQFNADLMNDSLYRMRLKEDDTLVTSTLSQWRRIFRANYSNEFRLVYQYHESGLAVPAAFNKAASLGNVSDGLKVGASLGLAEVRFDYVGNVQPKFREKLEKRIKDNPAVYSGIRSVEVSELPNGNVRYRFTAWSGTKSFETAQFTKKTDFDQLDAAFKAATPVPIALYKRRGFLSSLVILAIGGTAVPSALSWFEARKEQAVTKRAETLYQELKTAYNLYKDQKLSTQGLQREQQEKYFLRKTFTWNGRTVQLIAGPHGSRNNVEGTLEISQEIIRDPKEWLLICENLKDLYSRGDDLLKTALDIGLAYKMQKALDLPFEDPIPSHGDPEVVAAVEKQLGASREDVVAADLYFSYYSHMKLAVQLLKNRLEDWMAPQMFLTFRKSQAQIYRISEAEVERIMLQKADEMQDRRKLDQFYDLGIKVRRAVLKARNEIGQQRLKEILASYPDRSKILLVIGINHTPIVDVPSPSEAQEAQGGDFSVPKEHIKDLGEHLLAIKPYIKGRSLGQEKRRAESREPRAQVMSRGKMLALIGLGGAGVLVPVLLDLRSSKTPASIAVSPAATKVVQSDLVKNELKTIPLYIYYGRHLRAADFDQTKTFLDKAIANAPIGSNGKPNVIYIRESRSQEMAQGYISHALRLVAQGRPIKNFPIWTEWAQKIITRDQNAIPDKLDIYQDALRSYRADKRLGEEIDKSNQMLAAEGKIKRFQTLDEVLGWEIKEMGSLTEWVQAQVNYFKEKNIDTIATEEHDFESGLLEAINQEYIGKILRSLSKGDVGEILSFWGEALKASAESVQRRDVSLGALIQKLLEEDPRRALLHHRGQGHYEDHTVIVGRGRNAAGVENRTLTGFLKAHYARERSQASPTSQDGQKNLFLNLIINLLNSEEVAGTREIEAAANKMEAEIEKLPSAEQTKKWIDAFFQDLSRKYQKDPKKLPRAILDLFLERGYVTPKAHESLMRTAEGRSLGQEKRRAESREPRAQVMSRGKMLALIGLGGASVLAPVLLTQWASKKALVSPTVSPEPQGIQFEPAKEIKEKWTAFYSLHAYKLEFDYLRPDLDELFRRLGGRSTEYIVLFESGLLTPSMVHVKEEFEKLITQDDYFQNPRLRQMVQERVEDKNRKYRETAEYIRSGERSIRGYHAGEIRSTPPQGLFYTSLFDYLAKRQEEGYGINVEYETIDIETALYSLRGEYFRDRARRVLWEGKIEEYLRDMEESVRAGAASYKMRDERLYADQIPAALQKYPGKHLLMFRGTNHYGSEKMIPPQYAGKAFVASPFEQKMTQKDDLDITILGPKDIAIRSFSKAQPLEAPVLKTYLLQDVLVEALRGAWPYYTVSNYAWQKVVYPIALNMPPEMVRDLVKKVAQAKVANNAQLAALTLEWLKRLNISQIKPETIKDLERTASDFLNDTNIKPILKWAEEQAREWDKSEGKSLGVELSEDEINRSIEEFTTRKRWLETASFHSIEGEDLLSYARRLRQEKGVTRIYINLDNTLFRSMGYFTSSRWFYDSVQEFNIGHDDDKKYGINWTVDFWAGSGPEIHQLRNGGFYQLTEEGLASQIDAMQKEQFEVIGYTSRVKKRDKHRTTEILQSLNLRLPVIYSQRDGQYKGVLVRDAETARLQREGTLNPALVIDDSTQDLVSVLGADGNLLGLYYNNPAVHEIDEWDYSDYLMKGDEAAAKARKAEAQKNLGLAKKMYGHAFEYYFNAAIQVQMLRKTQPNLFAPSGRISVAMSRKEARRILDEIRNRLYPLESQPIEGWYDLKQFIEKLYDDDTNLFYDEKSRRKRPLKVPKIFMYDVDRVRDELQSLYSLNYLEGSPEKIEKLWRNAERVALLVNNLSKKLGLNNEIKNQLIIAAMLFPLGKGYTARNLELHFQGVAFRNMDPKEQLDYQQFLEDGFKLLNGDKERREARSLRPWKPVLTPIESQVLARAAFDAVNEDLKKTLPPDNQSLKKMLQTSDENMMHSNPELPLAISLLKLAIQYSESVSIRPLPGSEDNIKKAEDIKPWLEARVNEDQLLQSLDFSALLEVLEHFFRTRPPKPNLAEGVDLPTLHEETSLLAPFYDLSYLVWHLLALDGMNVSEDAYEYNLRQVLSRYILPQLKRKVSENIAPKVGGIESALKILSGEVPRYAIEDPWTLDVLKQYDAVILALDPKFLRARHAIFQRRDLEGFVMEMKNIEDQLKLLGEKLDPVFGEIRAKFHGYRARIQKKLLKEGRRVIYLVVDDSDAERFYLQAMLYGRYKTQALRGRVLIIPAKSPEDARRKLEGVQLGPRDYFICVTDMAMPPDPENGKTETDPEAGWKVVDYVRSKFPESNYSSQVRIGVNSSKLGTIKRNVDWALPKQQWLYFRFLDDEAEARLMGILQEDQNIKAKSLGNIAKAKPAFDQKMLVGTVRKNILGGSDEAHFLLPSSLLPKVDDASLDALLQNPNNGVSILWDGSETTPDMRLQYLNRLGMGRFLDRKNFKANMTNKKLDSVSSLSEQVQIATKNLAARGVTSEQICFLKPNALHEKSPGVLALKEGAPYPLFLMHYLIQTGGLLKNDLLGIFKRDIALGDFIASVDRELERIFTEQFATKLRDIAA